jgi:8-oxo-dGTP diphosphatase
MSNNRPLAVVAAIIRHENRFLLAKRGKNDKQGDHFEFPGGKIDFGETPEESLVREIIEELDCKIVVDKLFSIETEIYDDNRHILLLSYLCHLENVSENNNRPELHWFSPGDDLSHLPILPPDARNIERIHELYR